MKYFKKILVLILLLLFTFSCAMRKREGAVTITYLTRATVEELAIWEKVVKDFMKENPDIDVKLENVVYQEYWSKLLTMSAAQMTPDVVFMESTRLPAFVEKDSLLAFDELIEKDKDINLKDYYDISLDMSKYKGKLYGLPNDLAIIAMYYNKDLFDEYGVSYPQTGWTWNDLVEKGKKLTFDKNGDGNPDVFGITHYDWEIAIYQNGGYLVDNVAVPKKSILNTQPVIEALQWVYDLMYKYNIAPTASQRQEHDVNQMFESGKVAMLIAGHWMIPKFRLIKQFQWDVAVLPKGKRSATLAYGSCYSIPKASKHPEAAYRFIKYCAGFQGQKILVSNGFSVPALKKIANSKVYLTPPPKNQQAFLDMIKYGQLRPKTPNYLEMESLHRKELDLIWIGSKTPTQIVKNIDQEVNKILKQ